MLLVLYLLCDIIELSSIRILNFFDSLSVKNLDVHNCFLILISYLSCNRINIYLMRNFGANQRICYLNIVKRITGDMRISKLLKLVFIHNFLGHCFIKLRKYRFILIYCSIYSFKCFLRGEQKLLLLVFLLNGASNVF